MFWESVLVLSASTNMRKPAVMFNHNLVFLVVENSTYLLWFILEKRTTQFRVILLVNYTINQI